MSEDTAASAATDVKDGEITLADFDGEQETPKDSSPKDTKADAKVEPEGKDSKPEAEVPTPPDLSTKDTEDPEEKSGVEETEDKPTEEKSLAPKSENRFQSLANENRELRRQVEQLTAQTYQPATEEELTDQVNPETGENYNRLEAKFEAYRQQQELDKYNSQVVGAQAEIGSEAYSVMADFPIFNPDSQEFKNDNGELAGEAAQLLEANLIRDPNVPEIGPNGEPTGKGMVIGSNVSPYQLYKTLARASGISGQKGQLKGQQDTETMLANADAPTGAAPLKEIKDPLMELWKTDD